MSKDDQYNYNQDQYTTTGELIDSCLIYNTQKEEYMEHNKELFNQFICPLPDMTVLTRVCCAEAMYTLEAYVNTYQEKLYMPYLICKFNTVYTKIREEFSTLVNEHEAKISRIKDDIAQGIEFTPRSPRQQSEPMVTLCNVWKKNQHVDDSTADEYREEMRIGTTKLLWMIEKGYLYGDNNTTVEGFTWIGDLTKRDFDSAGDYIKHIGNGIAEHIRLEAWTEFKGLEPEQMRKEEADAEIMYGGAQDLFNTNDTLTEAYLKEQEAIRESSEQVFYSRDEAELLYNYYQLRHKFNEGFETYIELIETCKGILFPANYTSKKGKRYKSMWYGIKLKQIHKDELLAEYREIAEEFKAEIAEERRITEENIIDAKDLIKRFADMSGLEEVEETFDTDEAALLIKYAWHLKKTEKRTLFKGDIFRALDKRRQS